MNIRLEDAIAAAARIHAGQLDKAGEPYILHPLRVMAWVRAEPKFRIVAVLHDAVEDGGWERLLEALAHELGGDALLKDALPSWLLDALDALTRRQGEEYDAYIRRADQNVIARAVKVVDLRDNRDLSRLPEVTDADRARCEKYDRALAFLSGKVAVDGGES